MQQSIPKKVYWHVLKLFTSSFIRKNSRHKNFGGGGGNLPMLAFFQQFCQRGKIYCYANFFCFANFSIVFGPNFKRGKSLRGRGANGLKGGALPVEESQYGQRRNYTIAEVLVITFFKMNSRTWVSQVSKIQC